MQRFSDSEEPLIPGMVKINPIIHKFKLTEKQEEDIRSTPYKFGFGSFGEVVFNRTYSRKVNNKKEMFPDVVVRVVNGILSIRKNHYIINGFEWNDSDWDDEAVNIGKTMMKMHFLPPGRGLYMCGTEYSYKKGGAAFNNCGFCSTKDDLLHAVTWTMDSLMCGCGIGFDTKFEDKGEIVLPGCSECRFNKDATCKCGRMEYIVHDSREGWVKSVRLLLKTYFNKGLTVHFDYTQLREKGAELKGFGGVSSGYKPLEDLHNRIRFFMECYVEAKVDPFAAILNMCTRNGDTNSFEKVTSIKNEYDILTKIINDLEKTEIPTDGLKLERIKVTKTYGTSRLVADIFNAIGICVVAGNIRRSSEISLGVYGDDEFLNLKNYTLNPEREFIGWMSNNTIIMEKSIDFKGIPEISERIKVNGEPGIFNMINSKKYGRIGKKHPIGREAEEDMVDGLNPCGEICLESGEYCCLSEIFPSRCETYDEMVNATRIATFYASTISLLSTHWAKSNSIIARNHRIGVSISGIADFHDKFGFTDMTNIFKSLYKIVRFENKRLAIEAGVPESIRVTTVKPSGTISLLAGVSPGIHFPTYSYAIRTIRMSADSDMVPLLKEAGVKCEPDYYSGAGTLVFSFPIYQGSTRSAQNVSIWEQAMLQITLQREWSDNGTSCTLYFDPVTEGNILENVIAQTTPLIKGLSCIPHTDEGVYIQAPYQKITEEEYNTISAGIKAIKWEGYQEEAVLTKGCDGDSCDFNAFKLIAKK